MSSFKIFVGYFSTDGGPQEYVIRRVDEGVKKIGAAKNKLYDRVVVPTVAYIAETWAMMMKETRNLDVMEVKCMRSMSGLTRKGRWKNEEVNCNIGTREKISDRLDQEVERFSGERLTKRVYESGVQGRRHRSILEQSGFTESKTHAMLSHWS